MGSDYSIDVTDLSMFSGEVFLPLGEPCPHDCKHWGRSVIGHGPDDEHYELVVCDLSEERPENEDGSKNGCGCRSWVNAAWQKARDAGEPNPESLMELDFRVPEDDGLPDAPWLDRQARIEIGDALGVEIYREAIEGGFGDAEARELGWTDGKRPEVPEDFAEIVAYVQAVAAESPEAGAVEEEQGDPDAPWEVPAGYEELNARIAAFHSMPGCSVGGPLHIVVDDGNVERHHIEWCLSDEQRDGDYGIKHYGEEVWAEAIAIAEALLAVPTLAERERICMVHVPGTVTPSGGPAVGEPAPPERPTTALNDAEQFFAFLCRSGMPVAEAKAKAFGV